MTTAFVVLTAMPPTKGHINLIDFAAQLGDDFEAVLFTQPHEPMVAERADALYWAFPGHVRHINRTLPQDPATPGFWPMWRDIMCDEVGVTPQDMIVVSEEWGKDLANITGAKFIPYDPYREVFPCKATDVRLDPVANFHLIAPTFQSYLHKSITIFGAESTGKSTLARVLAHDYNGYYFMEWARPYLEVVGSEITVESMTDIWHGQRALEAHGNAYETLIDKPWSFYDTDLYSTIGYWRFPHWTPIIGEPPEQLIEDAGPPSDLYIITPSNIPFEEDPLRYGGDRREGSDEYWVQVAEDFGLNYVVLESSNLEDRIEECGDHLQVLRDQMTDQITFDRNGF